MFKKTISVLLGIVSLGGMYYSFSQYIGLENDDSNSLLLQNVEALTQNETVDHYWCCGNTGVCGKGSNVVIKGTLSTSPCQ